MLGLTLVLSAALTPLFTDEISSQIPIGRWLRDGYVLSNNLAACGVEASERPAALFSFPFLWAESVIHELIDRPGWIRLRSWATMVAWLLMLSFTWHSGPICVNVGVIELLITIFIVAAVAHCPAFGVKV